MLPNSMKINANSMQHALLTHCNHFAHTTAVYAFVVYYLHLYPQHLRLAAQLYDLNILSYKLLDFHHLWCEKHCSVTAICAICMQIPMHYITKIKKKFS